MHKKLAIVSLAILFGIGLFWGNAFAGVVRVSGHCAMCGAEIFVVDGIQQCPCCGPVDDDGIPTGSWEDFPEDEPDETIPPEEESIGPPEAPEHCAYCGGDFYLSDGLWEYDTATGFYFCSSGCYLMWLVEEGRESYVMDEVIEDEDVIDPEDISAICEEIGGIEEEEEAAISTEDII